MSQRLATKTARLPDKKSANIDKIIGLSNSCIVIRNMKFIKIFPETFFPKKNASVNIGEEEVSSIEKGNRPSYIRAAGHDLAVPLYDDN